jgi:hypothetical protein
MRHVHQEGELYLDGHAVGSVVAESDGGSWKFGRFTPSDAFSRFAPIFGTWSLFVHEDQERDRQSPEALAELRAAETAIDSLKAEILWHLSQERTPLVELIIDGSLIEWRQN